jgi:acyl-coenzyme A thioesterase PaaI-like protein
MMKASRLRRVMNWWPPFLFSGMRITKMSDDFRHVVVELRSYWFNKNYVGTHFGGSLFAMTDPFWMIMVLRNLGNDYVVWDKAAEIEFIKPGKGVVRAEFILDENALLSIKNATPGNEKHLQWFAVEVLDIQNEVVARVKKLIYIRRKSRQSAKA